jgi:hypothetical protein
LLTKESSSILQTTGPYNRPFARRTDTGFSIDDRAELRNLVFSRLLSVKVATGSGPALVVLDFRPRLPGKVALEHPGVLRESDDVVMGCSESPESFDEAEWVPLGRLGKGFRWFKILGIYHVAQKKLR